MRANRLYAVCCMFVLIAFAAGCQTAPVTGRSRLMLVGDMQMRELGMTAFQEMLEEKGISDDREKTTVLDRIGRRVSEVGDSYLIEYGKAPYEWEFALIESESANAFCLPGGKVGVYTGLINYTENEAELANVVAHEVAHAILEHGGERLSQSLLIQMGFTAIMIGMEEQDESVQAGVLAALGLGATVGVLMPYSRRHEFEADEVGLMLMAESGYDPEAAVTFWGRFAQQDKARMPEFLSTHPSDANRVQRLQANMQEAQIRYSRAPRQHGKGESLTRFHTEPETSE